MQIDDEQDHYEARPEPRSKIEVRKDQYYSPFKREDIGIFGLTQN